MREVTLKKQGGAILCTRKQLKPRGIQTHTTVSNTMYCNKPQTWEAPSCHQPSDCTTSQISTALHHHLIFMNLYILYCTTATLHIIVYSVFIAQYFHFILFTMDSVSSLLYFIHFPLCCVKFWISPHGDQQRFPLSYLILCTVCMYIVLFTAQGWGPTSVGFACLLIGVFVSTQTEPKEQIRFISYASRYKCHIKAEVYNPSSWC